MQLIVAGYEGGRSCVVSRTFWDHDPAAVDVSAKSIQDTNVANPNLRPIGSSEYRDYGIPVGVARWNRVRFPANQERPFHYSNTIDTHTIIGGKLWLQLDDGEHELAPGDSAIVQGVDHGWRIGPEGCVVSSVLYGLPGK